jgi:hypothetical protein
MAQYPRQFKREYLPITIRPPKGVCVFLIFLIIKNKLYYYFYFGVSPNSKCRPIRSVTPRSAPASPSGSVSPTSSEDSEYAFPHFLSVQDLASVPDCTIDFSLFTLSSAGMSRVPSAKVVVPTSRLSLKPPPVSRPKRSARVNMVNTAELALLLDVSTCLPDGPS